MAEPTTEQWQEIQTLLFAGKKIQAIKLYGEATGAGLAEAKEAMEAYTAKLYEQSPERFTRDPSSKKGCAGMILLFLLIAAAAVANLPVS